MRHPRQKQRHQFVCEMCLCALCSWLQNFSMQAILLTLSVLQPRSQAYSLSVHAHTLHQVNLIADTNDYLVHCHTQVLLLMEEMMHQSTGRISHFARVFPISQPVQDLFHHQYPRGIFSVEATFTHIQSSITCP